MLTLTLVRHGETALNAERRYQGRIDPPLSEHGAAQAAALANVLRRALSAEAAGHAAPPAPIVYASDSTRALHTAALALPGATVVPEPRLRELDFGAFDGRSYEENLDAHGDLFRAWIDDPAGVRPPGGETLPELEARIADWLDTLPRDGHVIAFTHGGPIHAILARLHRVPFVVARHHGVAPGDALRLIVPAHESGLVSPPVRLRDHAAGRGRHRPVRIRWGPGGPVVDPSQPTPRPTPSSWRNR